MYIVRNDFYFIILFIVSLLIITSFKNIIFGNQKNKYAKKKTLFQYINKLIIQYKNKFIDRIIFLIQSFLENIVYYSYLDNFL